MTLDFLCRWLFSQTQTIPAYLPLFIRIDSIISLQTNLSITLAADQIIRAIRRATIKRFPLFAGKEFDEYDKMNNALIPYVKRELLCRLLIA